MGRAVRKRAVVGPRTTGLGQGYGEAAAKGEGIQPGAHPEYQRGTPFGNPVKQLGDVWNKLFPNGQGRH
jgi:hypothetical protein